MTLLFAAVIWSVFVANAMANTIEVSPNPCPLPAEAKHYTPPTNIMAIPDDNQFDIGGDILILKDIKPPDVDEDGLFVRMAIDPKTGLPFAAPPSVSCFFDKH